MRWKTPAEEASTGQPAQQPTPTRTPASAPAPATGYDAATEVTAVVPLQGHTAAAGIGGDGEAVRPVEVPPAEDKAGGEEEEGGEVSGGTAGAAPTSSAAERATKKKN